MVFFVAMIAASRSERWRIGTRDRDPLEAQVLRKGAHAAAEDTGEMDAAASAFAENNGWRIDVDDRAFPDCFKQANDVGIAQAHAPVRQRSADHLLPVGAVDIDVALVRIHPRALVDPLLKTFEPENAGQDQIIFDRTLVPVGARINTVFENTAKRRA
jgi:hypothetical protein